MVQKQVDNYVCIVTHIDSLKSLHRFAFPSRRVKNCHARETHRERDGKRETARRESKSAIIKWLRAIRVHWPRLSDRES